MRLEQKTQLLESKLESQDLIQQNFARKALAVVPYDNRLALQNIFCKQPMSSALTANKESLGLDPTKPYEGDQDISTGNVHKLSYELNMSEKPMLFAKEIDLSVQHSCLKGQIIDAVLNNSILKILNLIGIDAPKYTDLRVENGKAIFVKSAVGNMNTKEGRGEGVPKDLSNLCDILYACLVFSITDQKPKNIGIVSRKSVKSGGAKYALYDCLSEFTSGQNFLEIFKRKYKESGNIADSIKYAFSFANSVDKNTYLLTELERFCGVNRDAFESEFLRSVKRIDAKIAKNSDKINVTIASSIDNVGQILGRSKVLTELQKRDILKEVHDFRKLSRQNVRVITIGANKMSKSKSSSNCVIRK